MRARDNKADLSKEKSKYRNIISHLDSHILMLMEKRGHNIYFV
jgi:hypothetical protein